MGGFAAITAWRRRASIAIGGMVIMLSVLSPVSASADVGATILERCLDHQSIAGYSAPEYQSALKDMPPLVLEYSPCPEQITKAELAASGLGTSPSGVASLEGKTIAPTSPQHRAIEKAHTRPAAVNIGGQVLLPGVVHANITSTTSDLPVSLLATTVLILASLAAMAGRTTTKRIIRSRRS